MSSTSRTLALVFAGLAAAASASPVQIPADGIVLQSGRRLTATAAGYDLGPARGQARITSFKEMFSKPPNRGVYRLERARKHYRKKALRGKNAFSLGKGVLTHLIYKKGRKNAEKNTRKSQSGGKKRNLFDGLLRGLKK